jgi:transposase
MFKTNDVITDGITAGTEMRQERGQQIATVAKITPKKDGSWSVPSMSGNGKYSVRLGETPHCTCPDHETRGCKCKHIYAVEYTIEREENADGTTTVTETVQITAQKRTTYPQNWPAYNAAQVCEKDEFQRLLHELCKGVTTPEQKGRGQRRIAMADAVFSVTFKVYSTVSGRRFMCDLKSAQDRGYVDALPHYNSVFNYLENPEMTPILERLIELSAVPLASVETAFAADSTGFTSSRFVRWYDHKYGTVHQEHDWVKAHIMCGVKTNVVTAVQIHDRDASDTKQLPALMDTTCRNFKVEEVSADKGYLSVSNADHVGVWGATPYIAFKANSNGAGGGLFAKMFHMFQAQRDEYLSHYHKRSNVESTVSMIKAKFRDHVRSKTDVAMKNEVLCKILCHNLCCLISAIHELGIDPKFLHTPAPRTFV